MWRTPSAEDVDVVSFAPDEEDDLVAVSVGASGEGGESGGSDAVTSPIPLTLKSALCDGIRDALGYGPAYGYPLHGVSVELVPEGCAFSGDTTPAAMQAAAMQAVGRALAEAGPHLFEPTMALEVEAPPGASSAAISAVVSDISAHRRGTIESVRHPDVTAPGLVNAVVPVAEMVGYSTHFRSITHGEASYSARLHSYQTAYAPPGM